MKSCGSHRLVLEQGEIVDFHRFPKEHHRGSGRRGIRRPLHQDVVHPQGSDSRSLHRGARGSGDRPLHPDPPTGTEGPSGRRVPAGHRHRSVGHTHHEEGGFGPAHHIALYHDTIPGLPGIPSSLRRDLRYGRSLTRSCPQRPADPGPPRQMSCKARHGPVHLSASGKPGIIDLLRPDEKRPEQGVKV